MSRENETFDAHAEVERIRARRTEARRKTYRKSRLDKYRKELVLMKLAGASCADLSEWLRVYHRCKVNRSSIDRYLRKLPEMQGGADAPDGDLAISIHKEMGGSGDAKLSIY